MDLKQFKFGFVLDVTNHLSSVLAKVEGQFTHLNETVKNTARMREYGQNLATIGGAIAGVGAAAGYGLYKLAQSAGAMNTEMSHVATAMNDGAATAINLAQAQSIAEKMSVKSGLSAIQEAQAYYIARSNMLNHTQALAAMNVSSKLTIATTASLGDAQAALEPTTRLLTTVYQNFGDTTRDANGQIKGFANTMAKLQTQYAFRDISEVNYAMANAAPLAKAAGISFNDMSASLALLSESGLHGERAGSAFADLLNKFNQGGKLRSYTALNAQGGIDIEKSLEHVKAMLAGKSAYEQALALHQLGFSQRSEAGVALMLGKLGQFKGIVSDLNNSKGALDTAFNARSAAWDIQVGRLSAAWENFKVTIGGGLLGPLAGIAGALGTAITWADKIATAHPAWTKFAVTTAAIGAGLLVVVGGALAVVGAVVAIASYAPAVATFAAAWWLTAGAVGIAVAAFGGLLAVFAPLRHFVAEAFSIGANIVIAIAKGIWSAATWPARAIESVVSKISGFLPHSPAKEGPLRDLHRVRIIESIAATMHPGPALAAMRRVAATVALAAPLVAVPAMAATVAVPRIATPAIMSAPASARGGASSGAVVINVTQHNVIQGGDPETIARELREHAYELAQIIHDEMMRRARTEF